MPGKCGNNPPPSSRSQRGRRSEGSSTAAVKKLIPVDTGINDDSVEMFKVLSETDFKNRLRLIPFKSIGNKNGILLGVKADKAEISFQGNRKVEKTEVILCLFSGKMDFDGSFNAIINYEILI